MACRKPGGILIAFPPRLAGWAAWTEIESQLQAQTKEEVQKRDIVFAPAGTERDWGTLHLRKEVMGTTPGWISVTVTRRDNQ